MEQNALTAAVAVRPLRARNVADGTPLKALVERGVVQPQPRSVRVGSRRTSLRLEQVCWDTLATVSRKHNMTMSAVLVLIENNTPEGVSFTTAVRSFLVAWLLNQNSTLVS